ncbi:MAG: NAD(+)/NADH kinase [Desulfobacterales bacterium]
MLPIGIIANPASGKDIRRLVAFGSVVPNSEKVNMVRRILLGLDSMGVKDVYLMPENAGIGRLALDRLKVSLSASFLDIPLENSQDDSTRAARLMTELGVACIITLGGDGTNRVVAKGCSQTPLLSVATGTNNAFCYMVEGTLAGIAAGVVASNHFPAEQLTRKSPKLEILNGSEVLDIALVDVVVSSSEFTASRAVWDVSTLREVFLTQSEPGNIGFSSLGGYICRLPEDTGQGMYIVIGEGRQKVRAPIAPGLVRWVPIKTHRIIEPGEIIALKTRHGVIALDGEREISVGDEDRLSVRLSREGPRVLNLTETLRYASEECVFITEQDLARQDPLDR